MARRGIGGVKARCRAWVSTGAEKIAGSALVSRASAFRLIAARHSDMFAAVDGRPSYPDGVKVSSMASGSAQRIELTHKRAARPLREAWRAKASFVALTMTWRRSAANGAALSMHRSDVGLGIGHPGGVVGASLFVGGAAQQPQFGVDPQEIGS